MLKIVHGFDEWLDMRELKETAASLNMKLYSLPSVPLVKFAKPTDQVRKWGLDGDGDLGVLSIHRWLRPRI